MFTREERRQIIDGHLTEVYRKKGLHRSPDRQIRDLDKVFAEAGGKRNSVEQSELIRKFEEHYSVFKRKSKWFMRVTSCGGVLMILPAEIERRNRRITDRLNKLKKKVNSPNEPRFWRSLADQFRSIPDTEKPLQAFWTCEMGEQDSVGKWWLTGGNDETRTIYRALARRGAAVLGYLGEVVGLTAWYDLLRRDSKYFCYDTFCRDHPLRLLRGKAGGQLQSLRESSWEYCIELEAQTFEAELKPCQGTMQKPNRRVALGEEASKLFDAEIRAGKSAGECLLGKLGHLKTDPWLEKLRGEGFVVESFRDIRNPDNKDHSTLFSRFKQMHYRRKKSIREVTLESNAE